MERKDNCLENCVFVKTLLMLIVLFGHSIAFWTQKWLDIEVVIPCTILGHGYTWINSFHIYGFTLASGYIFAFKIMRGGYSEYFPFLLNKARRLLVPYVFVMLIWVAPISSLLFNWDPGYVTKKYLLAIDPSQLWFLWMLFGVFAIAWPMRKLLLEKPFTGWTVALVLYGIGIIGRRLFPNVFCVWTACQFVLFFFVGMRIRVKEEKQERLITEELPWYCWIIIDLLLFAGTIIVGWNNGTVWRLMAIVLNMILHIVGAIMAWTTLQTLADDTNWKDSKTFKTLSSYSMPMYLFHQQIIYFMIIWLNGKINPWLNAGVNFAVALLGSFLISFILMHWKTTRFLIGEK